MMGEGGGLSRAGISVGDGDDDSTNRDSGVLAVQRLMGVNCMTRVRGNQNRST